MKIKESGFGRVRAKKLKLSVHYHHLHLIKSIICNNILPLPSHTHTDTDTDTDTDSAGPALPLGELGNCLRRLSGRRPQNFRKEPGSREKKQKFW